MDDTSPPPTLPAATWSPLAPAIEAAPAVRLSSGTLWLLFVVVTLGVTAGIFLALEIFAALIRNGAQVTIP
jgi:hypothetical protein